MSNIVIASLEEIADGPPLVVPYRMIAVVIMAAYERSPVRPTEVLLASVLDQLVDIVEKGTGHPTR